VALLAVRPATDALGVATPAGVAALATLLGALGLAYVGSGRLRG
jgi:pyridoxal biosynthesis lyase PdxS